MFKPTAHSFRPSGRPLAKPAWLSASSGQKVVPLRFGQEGDDVEPEPEPTPPPVAEPARSPAKVDRADAKTEYFPPSPPQPSAAERETIARFARAAIDLGAARSHALANVEEQLVELAVAIASAIVEREVQADPALHAALARSALETLGTAAGAHLSASREAYEAIVEAFGGPAITVDGVTVQVTLAESLDGLGCVAESEHARVDARLDERLRAVRRALEDERHRSKLEDEG